MDQLRFDFGLQTSVHQLTKPTGYKGLYGFHKYWGKKPAETVSFLIEQLSRPSEVVLDPFLGSGAIVREALMRERRVIACDLNPTAIELACLVTTPPAATAVRQSLKEVEVRVRQEIDSSYLLADGATATHYLWQENQLRQVWTKGSTGRLRIELLPTTTDFAVIEKFQNYQPKSLSTLRLFQNSRINSFENMQWGDLFTGRALRNLELLRSTILEIADAPVQRALLLALTAASGQMSKMVFAIENRGKTSGRNGNGRVEVGSWVIGFWRPALHFEVNVWNCFENKAHALLRGLQNESSYRQPPRVSHQPLDVLDKRADVSLVNADAVEFLATLPAGTVDLLVTDPPHGDRIPYLELSEIWNAILNSPAQLDREIVVSNARERGHTPERYAERMKRVFALAGQALSPRGRVAMMFNSRSAQEWDDMLAATQAGNLSFCGGFPMAYSAGSVVQDNRVGALKHDYVLVFLPSQSSGQSNVIWKQLKNLPHWTDKLPKLGEK
ncbi:MAG: DNA methyltransferase [Acidobacteriota bacterium]|nr:DNA methyltransferase [Acidobacteriota bacterium]